MVEKELIFKSCLLGMKVIISKKGKKQQLIVAECFFFFFFEGQKIALANISEKLHVT
jgi:hypothetical protein